MSYGATAARHAQAQNFDAALVLNVANGYFLSRLNRAGIPTAVNPDGIEWERGKWGRIGKAMFKYGAELTARHADEIVVDSTHIGHIWRASFGRESTFIPYGADVEEDIPADKLSSLRLRPSTFILAVARLVPENNIELLLDALDRLPSTIPAVIVGSATKPSALVRRLEHLSHSRPNFHWLGHISDQTMLKQLWGNAALYFHGHSVGGTNPALLQALGFGAPTIALETPYNAEVLAHPDQLVPLDAASLAAKIEDYYGDLDKRVTTALRGRRIVAERYSWEKVVKEYAAVLDELAARGNTTPDERVAPKLLRATRLNARLAARQSSSADSMRGAVR